MLSESATMPLMSAASRLTNSPTPRIASKADGRTSETRRTANSKAFFISFGVRSVPSWKRTFLRSTNKNEAPSLSASHFSQRCGKRLPIASVDTIVSNTFARISASSLKVMSTGCLAAQGFVAATTSVPPRMISCLDSSLAGFSFSACSRYSRASSYSPRRLARVAARESSMERVALS